MLDAAAEARLAAANLESMRRGKPRADSGAKSKFGFSNPMKKGGNGHNYHMNPSAEMESDAHNAAQASSGAGGEMTTHKMLPRGWFESVDPTTGNTYYYNDVGDTSWVRPTVSIV